ncbi:MAG TPA: NAD-dependent epimerase/dehydratase family protein, partial [Candidatus Acidoferrum sp.]|nr:NAD-dependent epimerase/dehydratase family protein [Candidatus Acidoferrum sp.]
MKIVLTGASGLVGTALTESLIRDGHAVVRLVRRGSSDKKGGKKNGGDAVNRKPSGLKNVIDVAWNPNTCDLEGEPFGQDQEKIEGADAAVNLAGASIAGESWSDERKALLRSSRVHITRELICALEKLEDGP